MSETRILQIVPHVPGTFDGVGDYALGLARVLAGEHGMRTTFLVASPAPSSAIDGFEVLSGFSKLFSASSPPFDHVILHYSNYGYATRGAPFQLRAFAQQFRRILRGRWITAFHELYASGPPWRSAFWTRPFQVKIARDLIDLSDACVVSNPVIREEINRYDSGKRVYQTAIMSNLGEPQLTDFNRSSTTWAICAGTVLLRRSLETFLQRRQAIPAVFRPERLELIGGRRDSEIQELGRQVNDIPVGYHPEVPAEAASALLTQCTFGWLDYYGAGKVWPAMIFKSGSLAAYCANGVVPVFAHRESEITWDGELFPGPFSITAREVHLPPPATVPQTAREVYGWYHRHSSGHRTGELYAKALR